MRPQISKIIYCLFFAVFLFFAAQLLIYHWHIIVYPYPLEYREPAIIISTDYMLKGQNPYSFSSQPVYINTYGFLYNLVNLPFARLFGVNFFVHRFISAVFLLLSCALVFWIMRCQKKGGLFKFLAVLVLYTGFLYFVTPLARPDGLGIFLFLSSIAVVYLCNYSWPSITMGMLLGICAFNTKAYFLLGSLYVVLYLFLFVSKRKGIMACLVLCIVLALSLILVQYHSDCYFNNTILSHWGADKETNLGIHFSMIQFRAFFGYYIASVLAFFLAGVMVFIGFLKSERGNLDKSLIDFRKMDMPFLRFRCDLFLFCLICSLGIVYFKLGTYPGNYRTYLFQLILPFLLIVMNGWLVNVKNDSVFVCLLIIDLCGLTPKRLLNESFLRMEEKRKPWQRLEQLIAENQLILNTPIIAHWLKDKNVYDTGLTGYFIKSVNRSSFFKSWYPPVSMIEEKHNLFLDDVSQKLERKEYDFIMINDLDYLGILMMNKIKKYYSYQESLFIEMPWERIWVHIWKPR